MRTVRRSFHKHPQVATLARRDGQAATVPSRASPRFNTTMAEQGARRQLASTKRRSELLDQLKNEREQRASLEKVIANRRFEWLKQLGTFVTVITALGALLFTGLSLQQSRNQNAISQDGQITSRYTAAVEQLGSQDVDVRLGGIFARERIMQNSTRDQPTIVELLSAFIRNHPPGSTAPTAIPASDKPLPRPPADVTAALEVLGRRNRPRDGGSVEDLTGTNFADLDMSRFDLDGAILTGTNFAGADLSYANLSKAIFSSDKPAFIVDITANNRTSSIAGCADLDGSNLDGANLAEADLNGANLSGASMDNAFTYQADLKNAIRSDAETARALALCRNTRP